MGSVCMPVCVTRRMLGSWCTSGLRFIPSNYEFEVLNLGSAVCHVFSVSLIFDMPCMLSNVEPNRENTQC